MPKNYRIRESDANHGTTFTVCFFTIATKDDGITQLIYITIFSKVDHVEAYCLAFVPVSSKIFPNGFY